MLESRFAPATVIQGDAYDLRRTLAPIADRRIAAVVSSLPLLNQPPRRREKLIADAFDLMGPEGVFVQFTYGLLSPIPREACVGRYAAHGGAPVWRNLPPARVWTYRFDARASPARFASGEARPQSRALQAGIRRQAGARGRSARAPPANPARAADEARRERHRRNQEPGAPEPPPRGRSMTALAPRDRLIVALDVPDAGEAERLVARIGDAASFYKIGMELAYGGDGLALVRRLAAAGLKVFLDLKLHDIPNTVERGDRAGRPARRDIPHRPRLSADDGARRSRARRARGSSSSPSPC